MSKIRNMKLRYKIGVGVASTAAVVGAGSAAFAYWSSTGTGTGTAQTATAAPSLTFSTSSISGLAPGVAATPFTVTVTNSGSQSSYVSGLTAYLTVTEATNAPAGTCTASDYLLNGYAGADSAHPQTISWSPVDLAAGAHQASGGTDTVQFNDTTSNQDACQGAVVTLNYASN